MKKYLIVLFFIGFLANSQQQPVQSPNTNQTTIKSNIGCVSGNCYNGWGKWQYDNGYYRGFWENSKKSGYGMYNWTEAGKYIGFWVQDKMEGYGVYFYNEKDEMSGYFLDGKLHGFGKNFKNGKWIQGIYNNGNLETEYSFVDNKVTTGCVAGDCQNKYGRYKWATGDDFTGFFKNGKMQVGIYVFSNGNKYEGMFNSDGRFHGSGRFFFNNKDYYAGNFSNGKYHGKGYYLYSNLETAIGNWTNGQLTNPY